MKQILELELSLHNQLGPSEKAKWEKLVAELIEAGEPPEFVEECVMHGNSEQ